MREPNAMQILLALIDEAFDHSAWHGPTLRGALRGVTAQGAEWRPGRGRHSIRELTVHAAYWKYAVRRRLLGAKRGSFPLKGSNWFERPTSPSKAAWAADVALLDETHRALRAAIAKLTPADLQVTPAGSRFNNYEIIAGIAAHDVYHAGQIQLLKRLAAR